MISYNIWNLAKNLQQVSQENGQKMRAWYERFPAVRVEAKQDDSEDAEGNEIGPGSLGYAMLQATLRSC